MTGLRLENSSTRWECCISHIMRMSRIQTPNDISHNGLWCFARNDESFFERSQTIEIQLSAGLEYDLLPDALSMTLTSLFVPMHYHTPQKVPCLGLVLSRLFPCVALHLLISLRPCRRPEQKGYDIIEYLSNVAF